MEQFSLEKYLANPSRKLVARCGYSVRILCTDKKSSLPIVALITDKNGEEFVGNYNLFGKYNDSDYACSFDLFFAPEKREGWVNLYKYANKDCAYYMGSINNSKAEAENKRDTSDKYIATIRIE